MKGARCLLLWLQVSFLAFAMALMAGQHAWLDTPCSYVGEAVGICECSLAQDGVSCRQEQLVLRASASVEFIFIFQLILVMSGCATAGASGLPVLKFLALPVLWMVFLFVPNPVFTTLSLVVSFIGAGFFVAQIIIVVDVAYKWNALWVEKATDTRMRNPTGRCHLVWFGSLVCFSVLFAALGLVLAVSLYGAYTGNGQRTISLTALIVSLVLLIVSITERCKHGALFVSAVVVLFGQWLVWQTLPKAGDQTFAPPVALELVVGMLTLVVLIVHNAGTGGSRPLGTVGLARGEAGLVSSDREEVNGWDFGVQCVVQAVAAAYLTAILAPSSGSASYVAHVVAVFLSLAVYTWILIAPMVLTGRQFNH